MATCFPYENRVPCINAGAPVQLVRNSRCKASSRVGMVSGWVLMVDCARVNVNSDCVLVRTTVFKDTTCCQLVRSEAFNAPGAARLVGRAVAMVAIACVNVRPRALKEANSDRMVSAATVAAGVGFARVPPQTPRA